jgi:putative flippase GtrA
MPSGRSLRSRLKRATREISKFGTVGLAGVVLNFVLLNLFIKMGLAPGRSGLLSTALATIFNYFGNKFWTYGHRQNDSQSRELVSFIVVSLVGAFLENGLLLFFGSSSLLVNNVLRFLGLGMATVFRLFAYRTWVFVHAPAQAQKKAAKAAKKASSAAVPPQDRETVSQ